MRKNLLKSFLLVLSFWWSLTTLWFSVANPETNLRVLVKLHRLLPFLPLHIPHSASALNALAIQLQIGKYWSLPVLGLTGILALAGAGIAAAYSWSKLRQRTHRENAGQGGWRKLRITLGELPKPPELPVIAAELEIPDAPDSPSLQAALNILPATHRKLISEVISVLAAHPQAFTGSGHGVTLLEHSLSVLETALRRMTPESDRLLPIAAISHDIGKITSFIQDDTGAWLRVKWHDKETARILATLPGWWNLEPVERQALLLAIKYDHSSGQMPLFPEEILNRARALQTALSGADRTVTAVEKENVLALHTLPELAVRALMQVLPLLPLHVAGNAPPKGVRAAGWKKDGILYLLEHQCRERAMATLDEEVAAAMGGNYRPQHKLARFTEELMKGLHEQGLLITEFNGSKASPDEAMWVIVSGTKEFKSVMAIRITPEMADRLPATDTAYDLTVTGCLKQKGPGEMAATDVDVSNLLRKKKPTIDRVPETPAPDPEQTSQSEPIVDQEPVPITVIAVEHVEPLVVPTSEPQPVPETGLKPKTRIESKVAPARPAEPESAPEIESSPDETRRLSVPISAGPELVSEQISATQGGHLAEASAKQVPHNATTEIKGMPLDRRQTPNNASVDAGSAPVTVYPKGKSSAGTSPASAVVAPLKSRPGTSQSLDMSKLLRRTTNSKATP